MVTSNELQGATKMKKNAKFTLPPENWNNCVLVQGKKGNTEVRSLKWQTFFWGGMRVWGSGKIHRSRGFPRKLRGSLWGCVEIPMECESSKKWVRWYLARPYTPTRKGKKERKTRVCGGEYNLQCFRKRTGKDRTGRD